jgi:LmbE family N-acetylglucosaminyl deacetylase
MGAGLVVVAAHPDDETLGASALLATPASAVVQLTDGAPRDVRWRAPGWEDRGAYAAARREELRAALALAGVPPERTFRLGAPDQEAAHALVPLARELAALLRELRPARLVAHAYEGGHPDHDAAAFVARAACALLRAGGGAAPALSEMALYHGAGGSFAALEFVGGGGDVVPLDADARARKARMLRCFETQRQLLERWPVPHELERLRPAPAYDFRRPPHGGPLWYERVGFPTTGARWRELAGAAAAALARERSG